MSTSFNGSNMVYLSVILIVYFTSVSFSFPSRPLNERRPDFTWQAWLLVDENQNRHSVFNSDGTLRRRITPKSVFIAPTFSPETLPACADGYSSDPMGRCIKIIKLDEEAHYDFIIKNLEDKFGSFDYDDEEKNEMDETSQGPLQLNIPLSIENDESKDEYSGEETDIAIVVSPTKPIVDIEHLNFKKRDSIVEELEHVKGLIANNTHTETTVPPLEVETTTSSIENETYSTTFENAGTTTTNDDLNVADIITKDDNGNSPVSTEIDSETTTVNEINRLDTTTEDPLTTLSVTESETTYVTYQTENEHKLITQSPKPIGLQNDSPYEPTSVQSRFEPTTVSPKTDAATEHFVRFPDQERSDHKFYNSFVRFPDNEYSYNTQIPPIGTKDVQDSVASSYNKPKASETPVAFTESVSFAGHKNIDFNEPHSVPNNAIRWEFNRRNRDKNSSVFMLPPKWNPSTFQKPLVLRFSRKHAFMDNNEFKTPAYYRSIPPDDFAYLFKFKQKRINR